MSTRTLERINMAKRIAEEARILIASAQKALRKINEDNILSALEEIEKYLRVYVLSLENRIRIVYDNTTVVEIDLTNKDVKIDRDVLLTTIRELLYKAEQELKYASEILEEENEYDP